MTAKRPDIAEVLAELDRARADRKEAFLRSVKERRLAAERFDRAKAEVIRPVFAELQRQLARRRHVTKVRDAVGALTLTVGVHAVEPRQGGLRIAQLDGDLDRVRIEFEGIPLLRKKFDIDLAAVDRDLVTRAVLRLVDGLLKEP
jgi:hypothetical protein